MNNEYSTDPLDQFRAWLDTDAVALCTATSTGAPSARIVLLKGADERGLVFCTSYEGRKGRELAENPRAAMLFHMDGRQIRVEGTVEPLEPAESDIYWEARPAGARSPRGCRTRAGPSSRGRSSTGASPSSTPRTRKSSRAHRTGATGSFPRSTSSGSTARTVCTSGSSIGATD